MLHSPQDQLEFDLEAALRMSEAAKTEFADRAQSSSGPAGGAGVEDEAEICMEIATAAKRAIRKSGKSREQIVDDINDYFGREENAGGRRLSIHMLNNYLSKPVEYPIPAFYLYAVQVVTGSLAPSQVMVEPLDAEIISGADIRLTKLGQVEQAITELQRLKRGLKERV